MLFRDLLEDLGVLDAETTSVALVAIASTSSLIKLIALTPCIRIECIEMCKYEESNW